MHVGMMGVWMTLILYIHIYTNIIRSSILYIPLQLVLELKISYALFYKNKSERKRVFLRTLLESLFLSNCVESKWNLQRNVILKRGKNQLIGTHRHFM